MWKVPAQEQGEPSPAGTAGVEEERTEANPHPYSSGLSWDNPLPGRTGTLTCGLKVSISADGP